MARGRPVAPVRAREEEPKRKEEAMARDRLRNARLDAGMTQQQVADHLGISLRNYQKMESGELLGRIASWDALEDLFGVNQRTLRQIGQGDSRRSRPG